MYKVQIADQETGEVRTVVKVRSKATAIEFLQNSTIALLNKNRMRVMTAKGRLVIFE